MTVVLRTAFALFSFLLCSSIHRNTLTPAVPTALLRTTCGRTLFTFQLGLSAEHLISITGISPSPDLSIPCQFVRRGSLIHIRPPLCSHEISDLKDDRFTSVCVGLLINASFSRLTENAPSPDIGPNRRLVAYGRFFLLQNNEQLWKMYVSTL